MSRSCAWPPYVTGWTASWTCLLTALIRDGDDVTWHTHRLFVEIAPNTLGLVHISEVELDRPVGVISEWAAGDSIDVKVLSVRLLLTLLQPACCICCGQDA